jgi:HAD superfamily hydrolase (TIGR01549 family)
MEGDRSSNLKVVIFDCDGVILDSKAANEALYNKMLAHFNEGPLTEQQINYVHSHTLSDSLIMLFRDDHMLQEARKLWDRMDYSPFIELLTLYPGFKECVEILHTLYRTAIATNRSRTMKEVLQRFGLDGYFDMVVTSLDVRRPKPHRESVDKILSHFNISAQEACYIGDSIVDQETARNGGVLFIAYRNRGLEADHHLTHFSELIPLLERLSPRPLVRKLS